MAFSTQILLKLFLFLGFVLHCVSALHPHLHPHLHPPLRHPHLLSHLHHPHLHHPHLHHPLGKGHKSPLTHPKHNEHSSSTGPWKKHKPPLTHPMNQEHSSLTGPWKDAHATFYGGPDGSGTPGGACGYADLKQKDFGSHTAALSQVLFNNGETCGACYEIKCVNDNQWCKPGQPSLFITATNLCPPNYNLPSDNGGWCNPPREHFDIAQPAFLEIAAYKSGIIPIQYRRIPCNTKGGIRFTVNGNPYFTTVLVSNVGGAGDVIALLVKGDKNIPWTPMKREWGQQWATNVKLVGSSLSFRVRSSNGKTSTSWHVAPNNWQFGQTFEGKNFL